MSMKAKDIPKLIQHLQSAIERDEGHIEFCKRCSQPDNPQIVEGRKRAEARVDLAQAILRALEHGDFVDLSFFTKQSH